MTQGDSSSTGVDILGAKAEDLCVGLDDSGEGLVELPDGDVFLLQARLLEELLDAGRGGDGEVNWV